MFSPPNLAEILGKISDGICVFTGNGEIEYTNEKASQLWNSPDDEFQLKVKAAFNDRAARRFEQFHPSLNRWFEHQTYPDDSGRLTLISREITARHRMEEALRASEERFRRVIESNVIGVIVVEAGVITEANDVFLRMMGSSRRELVTHGLHWRQMTPLEYDAADAEARSQLQKAGVFSPYEKEFFRKDGSRVPVLISGVTIEGPPNTPETLCLIMDLSARWRAEERVRSIVECSKILASSLECESTFPEMAEFVVSKLADTCSIIVRDADQRVRMAAVSRAPAGSAIETEDLVREVMTTGKSRTSSSPYSYAALPIMGRNEVNGVLIVGAARASAFDDEDLHLFDELARRAGLALENARMYHEVQRANRLKDEFVAIVSHELRTPLTPILGGVYMLRTEAHDPAIVSHALDLIERNAKAQVRIVDDLLDVSRALSGKLRLKMDTVDLAGVLRAAIDIVRPASEAKGIRIEASFQPLSGIISGDADRLQQVFWNLLANAVKFTPNDGQIDVQLLEHDGHAEVQVMDSGIGIEPNFLPHVFDKFRQADTSRTRVHGGLGLGLAIVRHLVESHGGTVHARSLGDEQGATFVVRLPLRAPARAMADQSN
jgi:PAS domain S-box-containing protein